MILSTLYSLGFTVIFTTDVSQYCPGVSNKAYGCYNSETKQIILTDKSPNFQQTLWHEIGHALYWYNPDLIELIKDHRNLASYKKRYTDERVAIEELKADWYAKFQLDKTYLILRAPKVYEYFVNNDYF